MSHHCQISIHAPVKGATPAFSYSVGHNFVISIHAPVKGATIEKGSRVLVYFNFNPRTREGCDMFLLVIIKEVYHFNPRTREGCDTKGTAKREL